MNNKKIYLPVTFEPEPCGNMLRADELYRPIRTAAYSVLFTNTMPGKDNEFEVTEVMFDTREYSFSELK